MSDLNEIIEDTITDATLPEPEVDLGTDSTETPLEATPEAPEATTESTEVKSPAAPEESKVDDFDKKYGLTAQGASGRENRIPYSRVRKITEKAVKDAEAAWKKTQDTSFTPATKYQELETRVKDYEGRLTQVAQFEQVMSQDPNRFLTMLSQLPAYQPFFQRLNEIVAQAEQPQQPVTQATTPATEEMPQPDQQLSDGSLVYSMDGLKKLNAWNRTQAKNETLTETQRILDERVKAVEQKYAPMAQSYESYQARQAVLPTVQRQISEARQWPLFNDSENEIVDALQKNPTWNLERAYQSVVLPKLQVNRDSMRQELLKEVKSAPRSTNAPVARAKPNQATAGSQSLEDIIKASLDGLTNR